MNKFMLLASASLLALAACQVPEETANNTTEVEQSENNSTVHETIEI